VFLLQPEQLRCCTATNGNKKNKGTNILCISPLLYKTTVSTPEHPRAPRIVVMVPTAAQKEEASGQIWMMVIGALWPSIRASSTSPPAGKL
jgi:hypothetical protein